MQQNRTLEMVTQQAQDAALRAYLDQMSQLMLQEGPVDEEPGSTLARARTLTVLPTLNADRKRSVLRFLYEAGLIDSESPVVDLTGADLRGADLHAADLSGADLSDVYLSGADLSDADLRNANLNEADLSAAYLFGADLSAAYLKNANLGDANLGDANLASANLGGAEGVTKEQLREAESLAGATMPDGQVLKGPESPNGPTFTEWLKSRGRGEAGENSGPS
jgi:uncharacterized protein YjbI with pentapeptide repeats